MKPAAGRRVGAAPEPLAVVEAALALAVDPLEADPVAEEADLEAAELALLTSELTLLRAELRALLALLMALLTEVPPFVVVPVSAAALVATLETLAVVAAPRAMSDVLEATVLVLSMTK